MKKNKVMFVFGTRPEAIKMAPLIKTFLNDKSIESKVVITSQHKEMLQQMMEIFELKADYDLNLMKHNQTLSYLTAQTLTKMEKILLDEKPDIIFVQGDTTTVMVSSLAAFYQKISVAHVEAGLRSFDKYSPFPEEKNRSITSQLADLHFAPTELSKSNLIKENISEKNIHVVGNSVIDSLLWMNEKVTKNIENYHKKYSYLASKKLILVTGHRRENFGEGIKNLCEALKELAQENLEIIYPVHLNPNVQKEVMNSLGNIGNIHLISPVPYNEMIYLINRSYFVITDSGGIQEEAPSLGKPVLVTRRETERPEGVEAGTLKIVGTGKEELLRSAKQLLNEKKVYGSMSNKVNPYGDGKTATRILKITKAYLNK